jgi:glycosyltransferase involved in cell wall biosynthesis
VIASDLPPLRELVTHGHTGLLVAPDDVDALATAIGTLARRADARHQLGHNAHEFVRAHRTWTAVHHTLTDLYASLNQGAVHV